MRKSLLITLLLAAIWAATGIAEPSKTMPPKHFNFPLGNEIPANTPVYPYIPNAALDDEIAGFTNWDMQSIGSSGNRIARHNYSNDYLAWSKTLSWPDTTWPDYVYYNYRTSGSVWSYPETGWQVNSAYFAGFPSLDLVYVDHGLFAYHKFNPGNNDNIIISIEQYPPGGGSFIHYIAPNEIFPQTQENPGICYWPKVAVDRNNNIHIVMHEKTNGSPFRIAYNRSEDGGESWIDPIIIDTCTVVGAVIDASPMTDHVAIAWPKPHNLNSQWQNDIVYILSEDGQSWDFENDIVNITNYANDDDSLWAYTDLDICLGVAGSVHLMWNAQWVTDTGVYWRTYLFHYNTATNLISEVFHYPELFFEDICGAWNRPICKMNMGIELWENDLWVVWSQFDTSDVSFTGFGNSNIRMAHTYDGIHWDRLENVTFTEDDGCLPGYCNSEHWASLADVVDDYMHITYINDKDAGSAIMNEGVHTENPVIYNDYWISGFQEYGSIAGRVTEADSITPIEGATIRMLRFDWESGSDITDIDGDYSKTLSWGYYNVEASKTGYQTETAYGIQAGIGSPGIANFQLERTVDISDVQPLPYSFRLNQNYPNPFNARTVISFALPAASPVLLEIFDITGAKVATLLDNYLPANTYEITWDAENFSSGIYFYKLKTQTETQTRKAVIIK